MVVLEWVLKMMGDDEAMDDMSGCCDDATGATRVLGGWGAAVAVVGAVVGAVPGAVAGTGGVSP